MKITFIINNKLLINMIYGKYKKTYLNFQEVVKINPSLLFLALTCVYIDELRWSHC